MACYCRTKSFLDKLPANNSIPLPLLESNGPMNNGHMIHWDITYNKGKKMRRKLVCKGNTICLWHSTVLHLQYTCMHCIRSGRNTQRLLPIIGLCTN